MKPMSHQVTDAVVADRELVSALEQIADIAGVPSDNRAVLIKALQREIAVARGFAGRVALFNGSDVKKSAKRIARAAAELADAMADESAAEFIRLEIDSPRPTSLADYRTLTARVAGAAATAAKRSDRDPWRLFRTMLREWLLRDVEEAGGSLTLNQRHPERSSLVAALDLLAPFLPAEFSKERSFSTLRRLRRGVREQRK